MNLTREWDYIERVARERLAHNKTEYHVDDYGSVIEVMGAAGELAARRFFGLDEDLHTGFDGGVDLIWKGKRIDVKATKFNKNMRWYHLQWPEGKPFKADYILLTAVAVKYKQATVLGYAKKAVVKRSPINNKRRYPCHEVPVKELRPPWELFLQEA